MTMYDQFKKLNIDLSQLGLGRENGRSAYFCTPKEAEMIGWTGVDGIHVCFVKGFGETVFAVSPANPLGDNVHPLARNFEDFLRLILTCGMDAAEQAWMWNREEFDAFLETYPPDSEQQVVLDALREALKLAPMDDPYGYIKKVQSTFDYGQIPYSKEYYELVSKEPETLEPPERPEWKVYFANGFSCQHMGHDRPGKEIPVSKTFTWAGKIWHILAVYVCGKGLVVDMCMEINTADFRSFMEKWRPRGEERRELTLEEREREEAEKPMNMAYTPKLTVNGKELRHRSGSGFSWAPVSCRPNEIRGEFNQQDGESLRLMEHYGLDAQRAWMFWRESFLWATKTRPLLKTVSLSLEQLPISVPGPRFTVSGTGDSVPFTHPVTGEAYTLHVAEYETQEMETSHFQDDDQWEYPTHYTAMSYVVKPELPRQFMTVRDCRQGDRPQFKTFAPAVPTAANAGGIIGSADGPTAIILTSGKSGPLRAVCSSLYFDPPKPIEWRMVFYPKTVKNIELDLPLPQS